MKTGRCNFGVGKVSAQPRKPQALSFRQSSGGARRLPPVAASNGLHGRSFDHQTDWDPTRDFEAYRLTASFESGEPSTSGRTEGYYHYDDDYPGDTLTPLPFKGANDRWMGGTSLSSLLGGSLPYMNPHYYPDSPLPHRLEDLEQVYIILFGLGMEEEGIYSLRAIRREDYLPQDTIIAFVDHEDAVKYSQLLEPTMQHSPSVIAINTSDLITFCTDFAYIIRVEPRGSQLIPPDFYVGMTDWERHVELKQGRFSVLESEPTLSPLNTPWASPEYRLQTPWPGLENNGELNDNPYQREAVRRQLEQIIFPSDASPPPGC